MWWHLEGLLAVLWEKGFLAQQITQSGHIRLVRDSTIAVLPMGKGDWLPDVLIRHNLQHTHLDMDEIAVGITKSERPN